MADGKNVARADKLVELAYALEDERLPVSARIAFVKRELALLARELLNDAAGVQVGSPQQSADPLDRCKAIRERVAELEAEIKRLTDEHNTLLGTGTVDAEDIAWAQGSAGNAGVPGAGKTVDGGM